MAKQAGLGTLVGSVQDIVGYAVDGRAYFRMKGGLDKAKWKRSPSMALSRDAARLFGAASCIAAGIWKNVPVEMKRIMAGGAFNRLVGACRMLVESDGNLGDVDGFRGVDFSAEPELAGLSGMRDEGGEMRVACASGVFDEGLKMKDEGLAPGGRADGAHGGGGGVAETVDSAGSAVNGFSGWCGAKKRRFCVAEPFTGKEKPDFVVEHERLGTISAFREGLAALRVEMGRPVVRRRRVWVAVCEVPTVHWVPRGKGRGGAFFLVQKGRYWLGRGSACSRWVVDSGGDSCGTGLMRDESGGMRVQLPAGFDERLRMKDESPGALGIWIRGLDVRGMVDEALLEARLDAERSEVSSGVFLVMVGLEVAEKRGRHWVRVPWECRVRVTDVKQNLEQNLQDSQNLQNWEQSRWLSGLQDCLRRSEDSQTRWLSGLQNWEQSRWLSGLQDCLNCAASRLDGEADHAASRLVGERRGKQTMVNNLQDSDGPSGCLDDVADLALARMGASDVADLALARMGASDVADLALARMGESDVADLVWAAMVVEFKGIRYIGSGLDWVGLEAMMGWIALGLGP